ncbi:hypothetical protein PCANB_001133 [Pneumocystis canis]|nr:hypothetical protein PCANB_001133 [Pneumocystis canis]
MEEVPIEELIQRLYAPENSGDKKLIEETHELLIKKQHSDQSLRLANLCMLSSDLNVQFFGILTFQMKTNSNWDNFKKDEMFSLLMNLLNWLKVYINGSIIIIRKLVSALSIFALKTVPNLWDRPIYYLMFFFSLGECPKLNNISALPDVGCLVMSLSSQQKRVLLMFSSSLLEEIEKSDISPSRRLQLHQVIQNSSSDIGLLLKHSFELAKDNDGNIDVICEAIYCFQVWGVFDCFSTSENIFEAVISCLLYKKTFLVAANSLSEIINHFPKLLSRKLMNKIQEILYNYWKDIDFVKIFQENGEFDEYVIILSRLIISLCEANINFFFDHLDDENSKIFIGIMLDLLGLPAFAIFQENISIETLEFFTLFVEMFNGTFLQKELSSDTIDFGKSITRKILENCLIKLRWPPQNLLGNWPKDMYDKFILYRRDIGDLLEVIFSFLQAELIEKLANLLNYFLVDVLDWENIEAIIFSLVYISEVYPEEESDSDKYIFRVFNSTLFFILSSSSHTQVKHSVIKLAGSYGSFMKRHSSIIPPVLTFLFNSLKDPELSYVSSKSIYKLCSECRFLITKELSTFLCIFKIISYDLTFLFYTKYRIFGAISCVIQSLPGNEQMQPLNILIQKIVEDLELAQSLKLKDFDKSRQLALSCINCLVFIGKSFFSYTATDTYTFEKYANNLLDLRNNEVTIQQCLMEIFLTAEEICNYREEVVQCICDALKSGLLEYFFGLSFSKIEIFIQYLFQRFQTYGYSCLISSATYLITHRKSDNNIDDINMLKFILHKFTSLFISFLEKNEINQVSDVLHEFFDFLKTYMYYNIDIFINIQPPNIFDNLMMLIINSLSSEDNFVRKGAANFLIDFITFHSNNQKEYDLIINIVLHYGIFIVRQIMISIAGKSSSFPVSLSDLLYKLGLKFPRNIRNWLLEIMNENISPFCNLDKAYKIDFVNEFMRIRISQKTNDLIKKFWLKVQNMENIS